MASAPELWPIKIVFLSQPRSFLINGSQIDSFASYGSGIFSMTIGIFVLFFSSE